MEKDEREMLIRVDQAVIDMKPGFEKLMDQPAKCAKSFVSYKVLGLIITCIGGVIVIIKFLLPKAALAALLALL